MLPPITRLFVAQRSKNIEPLSIVVCKLVSSVVPQDGLVAIPTTTYSGIKVTCHNSHVMSVPFEGHWTRFGRTPPLRRHYERLLGHHLR